MITYELRKEYEITNLRNYKNKKSDLCRVFCVGGMKASPSQLKKDRSFSPRLSL